MAFENRRSTQEDLDKYPIFKLANVRREGNSHRTWDISIDDELELLAMFVRSGDQAIGEEGYVCYGVATPKHWFRISKNNLKSGRNPNPIMNPEKTVRELQFLNYRIDVDPTYNGSVDDAKNLARVALAGYFQGQTNMIAANQRDKYPNDIKLIFTLEFSN